ncbi:MULTISPECIES: ATP-binding protein [unclassified Mycobacterium]|uniref:ATP-binding protein n=1 Tax=unclassified Mycobacterium TaxID=2642494 RepID=UPI0029C8539E|nr:MULTISPECIES: ATP-binding protein [unclassified Mycobacterium]
MIDSMPAADVANAERFERIGLAATLQTAARTREEFADWLRRSFDLDPVRLSDLVLAINEALANSAEFAYGANDVVGTMDLLAWHDSAESSITVVVADRGEWRMTDTAPTTRSRGRGIPLMRALSDRTAIETSLDGTQVRLVWTNVPRR